MKYENKSKVELLDLIKSYKDEVKDMVCIFNNQFEVKSELLSNKFNFYIQHKDIHWTRFIDVSINIDGEAAFSHSGSSCSSSGFSDEQIIDSSIEALLIARNILSMNSQVANILKEIHDISSLINRIEYQEEKDSYDRAFSESISFLGSKYEKASADTILEKVRREGRVELVGIGHFDSKEGKIDNEIFAVIDMGFGTGGSRLNLYLLERPIDIDSDEGYFTSDRSISTSYLSRFNNNTYFFEREIT